jgi:GxxExxY protein
MYRQDGWLVEEKRVHSIVGGFYTSYTNLGRGFREPVYCAALVVELLARGHRVQRECGVQVICRGKPLIWQRMDFVVDDRIILEVKATPHLPPDATRQLFNYLRATGLQVGLLLHYGLKPRFYRVFCKAERSEDPP